MAGRGLRGGQAVEGSCGGRDGCVDVGARMGRRDEARLIGGRREVHTLFQHPMEKRLNRSLSQAITLAKLSTLRSSVKNSPNIPHTWLAASGIPSSRPHRSAAGRGCPWSRSGGHGNPGPRRARVSRCPPPWPRGYRTRCPLDRRDERRELFHDVAPAAEGTHRHAAADDLAEGGEVGPHAIELLRAAESDSKSRHDLVEDQERAGLIAHLSQGFEETGAGGMQFMLPATGSTITQAISPPICRNASRTWSESL